MRHEALVQRLSPGEGSAAPTVDRRRLLAILSAHPHGRDYFNPWYGGGGAGRRRANLTRFLQCRQSAPILLVAEAPGYLGCRRSGVPLTDPAGLTGHGGSERTATVVHEVLSDLGIADSVVLWNVFPFHPHAPGRPEGNRTPSDTEVREHAGLVHLFSPALRQLVVAVGRKAELGLGAVGIKAIHVPHPSRRRAQFRAGLSQLVAGVPLVAGEAPVAGEPLMAGREAPLPVPGSGMSPAAMVTRARPRGARVRRHG